MISLRDSLKKLGEPKPNQAIPAIPSGFYSCPQSLMAAIRAMDPPLMENWTKVHVDSFYNEDWGESDEGITTDGNFWYLVSNNEDKRAIYKYSLDSGFIGSAASPINQHIGHPAYWDGKIYVPVEDPDEHAHARIWY